MNYCRQCEIRFGSAEEKCPICGRPRVDVDPNGADRADGREGSARA